MMVLTPYAVVLSLLAIPAGSEPQTKSPPTSQAATQEKLQAEINALQAQVKELRAQVNALTAALTACQASGALPASSSQRTEAIAALKAIDSALSGGANPDDFRKYYLQAKIKVDALPETADNQPLRHIADIYNDAASLLSAVRSASMSAREVAVLKSKYKELNSEPLNDLPDGGFETSTYQLRTNTVQDRLAKIDAEQKVELGRAAARFAAQDLFALARRELAALK